MSSGENVQRLCIIVPLKDGCWSVYPLVHQLVFVDCRREDEYPCISVAIIFSLEASCCVSRGPGNESTMNLAEWEVGSCFFGVNKSWEKIDHSSIVQNVNVVGELWNFLVIPLHSASSSVSFLAIFTQLTLLIWSSHSRSSSFCSCSSLSLWFILYLSPAFKMLFIF